MRLSWSTRDFILERLGFPSKFFYGLATGHMYNIRPRDFLLLDSIVVLVTWEKLTNGN